jgi:hypothetical protein
LVFRGSICRRCDVRGSQCRSHRRASRYAALNHFFNVRTLADASYRDGGAPNNDTLYSIAWIDVRKEPVILSYPEMGYRYFTFELASLDSDNFAYAGLRTTGAKMVASC